MNPLVTRIVTSIAGKAGYFVAPKWRMRTHALESQLRALFTRYDIKMVLDVGANTGQFHDFLRDQVEFDGVIHSFEPLSEMVAHMRARSQSDPHWHIHHMALGAERGELPINVMASSDFTSFLPPSATESNRFTAQNSVVRTENVTIHPLDDLAETLGLTATTGIYLKADTQGFDREVFRGATRTLEKVQALQFELGIQRLYEGVPHHADMLREMEERGFDLAGFFPVSSDQHLRVLEFDCVMVRHPAGSASKP